MAVIKAKDFEDLIKRVNPFGIRIEGGEAASFADYGKCYFWVLCFLREHFHKGFIDIPLFLHQIMQMSLTDARNVAKKLPFIEMENEIFLCPWEEKDADVKHQAELLMRALHSLSGTTFSNDFFSWAWEQFIRLENYKSM